MEAHDDMAFHFARPMGVPKVFKMREEKEPEPDPEPKRKPVKRRRKKRKPTKNKKL